MLAEAYVAAEEPNQVNKVASLLHVYCSKQEEFKQVKLLISSGHAATYLENMFLLDAVTIGSAHVGSNFSMMKSMHEVKHLLLTGCNNGQQSVSIWSSKKKKGSCELNRWPSSVTATTSWHFKFCALLDRL